MHWRSAADRREKGVDEEFGFGVVVGHGVPEGALVAAMPAGSTRTRRRDREASASFCATRFCPRSQMCEGVADARTPGEGRG